MKCKNNGECKDNRCECPIGFSGELCEKNERLWLFFKMIGVLSLLLLMFYIVKNIIKKMKR